MNSWCKKLKFWKQDVEFLNYEKKTVKHHKPCKFMELILSSLQFDLNQQEFEPFSGVCNLKLK